MTGHQVSLASREPAAVDCCPVVLIQHDGSDVCSNSAAVGLAYRLAAPLCETHRSH